MREAHGTDGTFLGLCSELLLERGVEHLFTSGQTGTADPGAVAEDSLEHLSDLQRKACRALAVPIGAAAPTRLRALRQVHGSTVLSVPGGTPCWSSPWPSGDGLVGDDPRDLFAIRTADCLPLVLADPLSGRVAAVHVGWRGLVAGIVPAALAHFAHAPLAALGPCIGRSRFEIGPEVAARFRDVGLGLALTDPSHSSTSTSDDAACAPLEATPARSQVSGSDRSHADLRAAVHSQLTDAGVREIDGSAPCTYDDRRFPSHRRDVTHEGRFSTGRLHTLVRPGQPATSETS